MFVVLSIGLAALIGVALFWIWNPRAGVDVAADAAAGESFDAVVVLASGENRRDTAREIVAAGVSDNLVVSVTPKMVDETDAGALPKLTPAQVEGATDAMLTDREGPSGWLSTATLTISTTPCHASTQNHSQPKVKQLGSQNWQKNVAGILWSS